LRAIAAELNQRGIPTALGTGKWSKTQVERVMSRHEELKKFRLGPGAANARIASERAAAIAPIIAEIRAAGATSLRAIVAELIKRGIPTARGTGSWSASQVARVMSRREGRKTRRRKSSHRI
jgi:homoserine kinase